MKQLILTQGQKYDIETDTFTGPVSDIILEGINEVFEQPEGLYLYLEQPRDLFKAQELTGWQRIQMRHPVKRYVIYCLVALYHELPESEDAQALCCWYLDQPTTDFYYSQWKFSNIRTDCIAS